MDMMSPTCVAKYYLLKASEVGDLISNLKMQKLVYYAYSWVLVIAKTKLFEEKIEAWVSGPVTPSLYQALRTYGSSPIGSEFVDDEKMVLGKVSELPTDVRTTLDQVFDSYMQMTAFELVAATHAEKPWRNARAGLEPQEQSKRPIADEDIVSEYGSRIS